MVKYFRDIILLSFFALAGCALEQKENDESQRFADFIEAVYQRRIASHPMLAAQLGVDKDQDKWDDFSMERREEEIGLHQRDLLTLHQEFDYERLEEETQLNYRAFEADLELRIERDLWRYHISPINQIVGLHLEIVGILKNSHPIESVTDARAYITRMVAVGTPLDQFIKFLKIREEKGFFLSKSVIPRLIGAARSIIADPVEGDRKDSNILLVDFSRKISHLDISEQNKTQLVTDVKQALRQHFIPAYQRLIRAFEDHQKFDVNDRGVWRMPDGDQFYQFLLRQFTTTDITADEVHSYGLSEVARIHQEMEQIKKKVAFDGDLKAFFDHLKTSPQFHYPNTEQGRADYLQDTNLIVAQAKDRIETILSVPMQHDLIIKRMEAYREKSAPIAFYEGGEAEGDTPGTIYLGMYDMAGIGRYDMNSLLYHEGIPGHHMQLSIMQSQKHIPNLRKYYVWWSNTAFTEGWALYAEYLAKEMGLYTDPYAEFGRLAGELWRACRLVVDSGLHAKRWTRQQSIDYFNENTANSEENNAREVDRYLAVPGQAIAFKIGMRKILQLREKARLQLLDKFDVREFHYIILKNGPLPLHLLEGEVDHWVKNKKG